MARGLILIFSMGNVLFSEFKPYHEIFKFTNFILFFDFQYLWIKSVLCLAAVLSSSWCRGISSSNSVLTSLIFSGSKLFQYVRSISQLCNLQFTQNLSLLFIWVNRRSCLFNKLQNLAEFYISSQLSFVFQIETVAAGQLVLV